jgi:hypothetical protein
VSDHLLAGFGTPGADDKRRRFKRGKNKKESFARQGQDMATQRHGVEKE